MRLLALFPDHLNPQAIGAFVASMLGDGWTVDAAADPDDAPLAEAEIILDALVPLTDGHFASADKLRFVQTPSHGFDHIDLDAAAARGVPVSNVGTSGAEAANVAEHAFLLMLACAKRLVDGHAALREGRWPPQAELLSLGMTELRGKTLGIVGLGQIGREVAKRARAFEMTVLFTDVVDADDEALERASLEDLLQRADFVTVHVPLMASTRGLIGADELARMKQGAVLVNTSRGPVVDNHALADALGAGRITAGIDVFDPEPAPPDHPLLRAPNVVLSPHVAGVTNESVRRIMFEAIENVRRFAAGERPRDVVNGL
jgi:phosphoglycerate dehydrogenase-like enzyme